MIKLNFGTLTRNIETVFNSLETPNPFYLDRKLNPTQDITQQIDFIDVIKVINNQKWEYQGQRYASAVKIWKQLSTIYIQPAIANILLKSICVRAGKSSIPNEEDRLSETLFHFMCIRKSLAPYVSYSYALKHLVNIIQSAPKFGLEFENNEVFMTYERMKTIAGLAYFFQITSKPARELPENLLCQDQMTSKNPEVYYLAHWLHFDRQLNIAAKNFDDLANSHSKACVYLETGHKDALSFFPTLQKIIKMNTEWLNGRKQENLIYFGMISEEDCHQNNRIIEAFPELIDEIKKSESIFEALKQEYFFLRKKGGPSKREHSFNFQSKHFENWTPTEKEYREIEIETEEKPLEETLQFPLEERLKEYMSGNYSFEEKWITIYDRSQEEKKAQESKELEIEAPCEEPTLESPNWKEVIGVSKELHGPIQYHSRVTRWFESPDIVISSDPKYSALPPMVKNKIILFHAFPQIIDQFVGTQYSVTTSGNGYDTYSIPTRIEILGSNKTTYQGFFNYAFNSQKQSNLGHLKLLFTFLSAEYNDTHYSEK